MGNGLIKIRGRVIVTVSFRQVIECHLALPRALSQIHYGIGCSIGLNTNLKAHFYSRVIHSFIQSHAIDIKRIFAISTTC